jgi:hypothetical protein
MYFIIGGHPRSGTTMLFELFRRHPAVGITGEFRCFQRLGVPYPKHVAGLQTKWYKKSFIQHIGPRSPWVFNLLSGIFLARYLYLLRTRVGSRLVTAEDVANVLGGIFRKPLVGDKYPRYIFNIDKFCKLPDMKRVMIYRDGRDVVSSFLYQLRTRWKGLPIAEKGLTVQDITLKWVDSIEKTERNSDRLFVIRYEDFVNDPSPVLQRLGVYLGVDPDGFRTRGVHDRSIGKFQTGLTGDELREVMKIGGDTLERLKYT